MQLRDSEPISADAASGPDSAAPASSGVRTAAPCPIVALSDDPLLLEALAGLGLAGIGVMSSPSSDRFIDQLVANSAGAGIAIIDAASVSTSLKGFLATLGEQFPQLLVMLHGPAHLQAQFEAQISDGTIFRFVHKPASSQRLRLFIDAALRKLATPEPSAGKARAPSAAAAPTPIPLANATPAAQRSTASEPPSGERRRGFPFTLVLLGLVIVSAAAWALWHYEFAPNGTAACAGRTGCFWRHLAGAVEHCHYTAGFDRNATGCDEPTSRTCPTHHTTAPRAMPPGRRRHWNRRSATRRERVPTRWLSMCSWPASAWQAAL